jgi:hypothetical protein
VSKLETGDTEPALILVVFLPSMRRNGDIYKVKILATLIISNSIQFVHKMSFHNISNA